MRNHKRPEIELWEETCIEFINKAPTMPELESVAAEIKSSAAMINASDEVLKRIRVVYIQRAAQLKAMQ